jgi:hypothetical protein
MTDRPHPGRASTLILRLIDLVLESPTPAEAVRTLERLRDELRTRWNDNLTLGEAGEIEQLSGELEKILADLHDVIDHRRTPPATPHAPSMTDDSDFEE